MLLTKWDDIFITFY